MYEQLFRSVLLPAHERLIRGRKSGFYYKEYDMQQYLSYEELKKLQLVKLKKLLSYSYKNIEFYHLLWKRLGFHPNDLTSLQIFEQLPFLTKDVIKENYSILVSKELKKSNLKKATGGSTGTPLVFEYTEESYLRRNAVMWRGYAWANMRPGRKSTYLWGTNTHGNTVLGDFKERLYHKLYGRQILPCFKMDDTIINDFVRKINKRKPKIIVSYVNPMYTLAKWISERDIEVHSPISVITGAEPLHEFQRNLIRKVFSTEVYNTYGSREFMLMASECNEFNGMHMNVDHLVIETVNVEGRSLKGEIGEVVVTDLHNYGMPFIRYKNEDLAIISDRKCKCGLELPMMEKIVGRTLDCIYTTDGKVVPGEFFPHFFKDYQCIEKFQVVQKELTKLDINLVVNSEYNDYIQGIIFNKVVEILGEAINIKINIRSEIPVTSSGKHRVTISKL